MSVRVLAGDIFLMLLHLIFSEGKYKYPPRLSRFSREAGFAAGGGAGEELGINLALGRY